MPARVLVSTFGSAGDVFPLVPVIQAIQARGDDVRVAIRRGMGLYLRSIGIPTIGLGDGSELFVVSDAAAVSERFDGWSSWRHTVLNYVTPLLRHDIDVITRACGDWVPDVVLTSGFAAAARIVALRDGVPLVDASIYPQHARFSTSGSGFAKAYRRAVATSLGTSDDTIISRACWGVPADVYLHDRVLLAGKHAALPIAGYPLWDDLPTQALDLDRAMRFLEAPAAIVTFGSFLGLTQRQSWIAATRALVQAGHRVLLVGPPRGWASDTLADGRDVMAVGFVPLSRIMPKACFAVHHGGLGTTLTTLAAGTPALVLPLAYDQPDNAQMVAAAGAGVRTSIETVMADVAAFDHAGLRPAVEALASRLGPREMSVATVLALLDTALRGAP